MKKFIQFLVAGVVAMCAVSVMAQKVPDGKSGFASSDACLTAVRSGSAQAYKPVTSRSPGPAYAQMSMADAGYINGACVQGLTTFTLGAWVYLPPTFQVGKREETLVMWQCGNAITSIAKVPMDQLITRAPPATNFDTTPQSCSASQEKCEMISWCDQNKGWETRTVNGVTEQFCSVPSINRHVQRTTNTTIEDKHVITPIQTIEVLPVQAAAPANVDFLNAQVNVRGGGVDVSGTKCRFDCVNREVAHDVVGFQNIPNTNKQCEIRYAAEYASQTEAQSVAKGRPVAFNVKNNKWQVQGRLLLDRNPGDQKPVDTGKILMTEVIGGKMVLSRSAGKHTGDCSVDQSEVKKNWDSVVRNMELPPTCKPN
jgi:hypothetical protein